MRERQYDHDAIRAFLAAGNGIDTTRRRFGCSRSLVSAIRTVPLDRRVVLTPILPAFAALAPRKEPKPVFYNGIDLADVDHALDNGERLADLARDYGCKNANALVKKAAGGPGGIGIDEAKRRLDAGEKPTSVALRARLSLGAMHTGIRAAALDAAIEEACKLPAPEPKVPRIFARKAERAAPKKCDRVWPEETVDRIALYWCKGMPTAEIAAKLGLTKSIVVGLAKRRRDAGDNRFARRLGEKPAAKTDVREVLARKIRTLVEPVSYGEGSATAARLGLHPSEFSRIAKNLRLDTFSHAKLLQVLKRAGAKVKVTATITSNGRSFVVVLPLNGRSPI